MKYERLFTPIKIRNLELKNRVIMPAIHMMHNMDGHACSQSNEFYWRRAEGGPGLILVGGCRFDEYGGNPGMMSLETDDYIPGYKEFTDGMHARGCPVGVQIFHGGAYAHQIANEGRQALAPSAVYSKFTKEMPREATVEEIHTIIRKWAEGAVRAKKAGFDLIEIIASAGYLISQFLSPVTNLRTDEYGGSFENRTRFARELVPAIREAVGDFPIGMRISGNDFVEGSNTNKEAVEFAKMMEEAGLDYINVTGGWHESVIPQIPGDVAPAGYSYLAAAVADAVSIPVAASNRINDPFVAENLIATGQADMVCVGRPQITDPDWAKKAEAGDSDNIRKCLACNQMCLAKTFFAEPAECLINPFAGKEGELKVIPTGQPKKILVIGGGPAGCEAAILMAERGHKVTLWEKCDKLGGQLHTIKKIPSKAEFGKLPTYFASELKKQGVDVVLSKDATVDEIKAAGFDSVIVAAGSTPKLIKLPDCNIPIVKAEDVLLDKVVCGKNVLVIGGGPTGCETAQYLVRQAAIAPETFRFMLFQHSETIEVIQSYVNKTWRNVAILDMVKIGAGFEQGTAWPLLKELGNYGVKLYPFGKLESAKDGEITIVAQEQKTREQRIKERETGIVEPAREITVTIPCDTIVSAIGSIPNTELLEALKAAGVDAYGIGDTEGVGNIAHAMATALEVGLKI